MPAPRKIPTRAASTPPASNPASSIASAAACRPMRSPRERRRRSSAVSGASMSVIGTWAAMRLRYPSASKTLKGPIPHSPSSIRRHDSSRVAPSAVTRPTPAWPHGASSLRLNRARPRCRAISPRLAVIQRRARAPSGARGACISTTEQTAGPETAAIRRRSRDRRRDAIHCDRPAIPARLAIAADHAAAPADCERAHRVRPASGPSAHVDMNSRGRGPAPGPC